MAEIDRLVLALIAERERLGLGIRETARLAGMGHMPTRISEAELGYASPTLRTLRLWATGLGCDLALVTLLSTQSATSPAQPGSNNEESQS